MKARTLMRLRKVKDPDGLLEKYEAKDLVAQIKYDGHLTLASKQKGKVRLFTRRGNDISARLPALVNALHKAMPDETAVLGELVYIDDGMKLYELQKIVRSKPKRAIALQDELPGKIKFAIFDSLEYKGDCVESEPYTKRFKLADGIAAKLAAKYRWRVKSYPFSKVDEVVRKALSQGGEGAVIKAKDGIYKSRATGSSEAFGEQWKFKPPGLTARTDDVLLMSYTKGKEKLIFPAYQDLNGDLMEVGKLSGLDKPTERKVQKQIDQGKKVVAEVTYQERMPSGKFRHMGWSRLRPDKPVKSVTYSENPMRRRNSRKRKPLLKDAGRAAVGAGTGALVAGPLGAAGGAFVADEFRLARRRNPDDDERWLGTGGRAAAGAGLGALAFGPIGAAVGGYGAAKYRLRKRNPVKPELIEGLGVWYLGPSQDGMYNRYMTVDKQVIIGTFETPRGVRAFAYRKPFPTPSQLDKEIPNYRVFDDYEDDYEAVADIVEMHSLSRTMSDDNIARMYQNREGIDPTLMEFGKSISVFDNPMHRMIAKRQRARVNPRRRRNPFSRLFSPKGYILWSINNFGTPYTPHPRFRSEKQKLKREDVIDELQQEGLIFEVGNDTWVLTDEGLDVLNEYDDRREQALMTETTYGDYMSEQLMEE